MGKSVHELSLMLLTIQVKLRQLQVMVEDLSKRIDAIQNDNEFTPNDRENKEG